MLSACAKTPETSAPIEEPKAQLQQQQPAPEPIPKPQSPTWEEQYDLGLRYLSEGKYEEAIIAFTAAIEIDLKRAPAFVGRGDTYVELAKPGTNLTSYDNAEKDYQAALELDDQAVEVYVKLSDVYLAIDEPVKAVEILQQGYDVTGAENLKDRIETLQKELASGTFIGIPIDNWSVYRVQREAFEHQYAPVTVGIWAWGIQFPAPAKVIVADASGKFNEVEISEAHLESDYLNGPDSHYLFDPETGKIRSLLGKTVEFTGYFDFHDIGEIIPQERDGNFWYDYNPSGPYTFYIEAVHDIEVDEPIDE